MLEMDRYTYDLKKRHLCIVTKFNKTHTCSTTYSFMKRKGTENVYSGNVGDGPWLSGTGKPCRDVKLLI